MGDDRLDGEVSSFASRTNAIHSGSIYHDGRHAIASPQEEDASVKQWGSRLCIAQSQEIEGSHQDKDGEQDTGSPTTHLADNHPTCKGGDEAHERTGYTTHHADFLDAISQIDQPRTNHRQGTNQARIIEEKETDLLPDAPLGEEIKYIGFLGPLLRKLGGNLNAFVEEKRQ